MTKENKNDINSSVILKKHNKIRSKFDDYPIIIKMKKYFNYLF